MRRLQRQRLARRDATPEPSAALFSGIRTSLTFWYCGVLGGALLVVGVVLYLVVQYTLLRPVDQDLARRAARVVATWERRPDLACLQARFILPSVPGGGADAHVAVVPVGPGAGLDQPLYVECYDPTGTLIQTGAAQELPASLLASGLALSAIHGGAAADTVEGGPDFGPMRRYAVAVPDPSGNGIMGVVLVGISVGSQMEALHALLNLLLIMGVAALAGAALGGLFLSGRALAPARLAFSRQQSFIANAAHELRTPLTLLRADAEVLLRGRERFAPEDAELLEDIVAESAHMGSLASNMLALARLDAGRLHVEQEVVDLAAVAGGVVRRAGALAAKLGLTLEVQAPLPVLVLGDPLLLEQIVLIVLDNAIKYNRPGGTVTIRAHVTEQSAHLEVSDTGIGIPAEHLPHLGERFYRVDKARSREAGGAGLGLSIARGLAATQQGSLTLASWPDRGTTAVLTLPAARSTPAPPPEGSEGPRHARRARP